MDNIMPVSFLRPAVPEVLNSITHVNVRKVRFFWAIQNYSFCPKVMKSPVFWAHDLDNYKLQISSCWERNDYLSLYLQLVSSGESKIQMKFAFFIMNSKEEFCCKSEVDRISAETEKKYGFQFYIAKECLNNPTNNYLLHDTLKIVCDVALVDGTAKSTESILNKGIRADSTLSADLSNLLNKEEFSDVALIVQDTVLPAHKAILASRSDVFAAMFNHKFLETTTNRVLIKDIDEDVAVEMLRFIYTGNTEKLGIMAGKLLAAADKYALEDLKQSCSAILSRGITCATAVDTLVLADLYQADQLKDDAINFICANASAILKTADWKKLKHECPHLGTEIYERCQCHISSKIIEIISKDDNLTCMAFTPAPEVICSLTNVNVMKVRYTWAIENFSFCQKAMKSPIFWAQDLDKFEFQVSICWESPDYLSLYLQLVSCDESKIEMKLSFSILNALEHPCNTNILDRLPLVSGKNYGFQYFMTTACLKDPKNKYLNQDTLQIVCEVALLDGSVHSEKSKSNKRTITEKKLSTDLSKLLNNEEFSDVTLSVKDTVLQAHKAILASRSNVFAAMFNHKFVENTTNRVVITDVDEDVVVEMLRFIYTGNTTKLYKMAEELLAAADMYALEDLKQCCSAILSRGITSATAVKTLVLADLRQAEELKQNAIDFINLNSSVILKTADWKQLKSEYPRLGFEIFERCLKPAT